MAYRIMDKSVLQDAADFQMKLDIPETVYSKKNPDGTQPVVTLAIQADTIAFAVGVLRQMNETDMVAEVIAGGIFSAEYIEALESGDDAAAQLANAKFEEVHDEFLTFGCEVKGENDEKFSMNLTAPSGAIAYHSFQSMTSEQRLNAFVLNLMPLDEDDDF